MNGEKKRKKWEFFQDEWWEVFQDEWNNIHPWLKLLQLNVIIV